MIELSVPRWYPCKRPSAPRRALHENHELWPDQSDHHRETTENRTRNGWKMGKWHGTWRWNLGMFHPFSENDDLGMIKWNDKVISSIDKASNLGLMTCNYSILRQCLMGTYRISNGKYRIQCTVAKKKLSWLATSSLVDEFASNLLFNMFVCQNSLQ